MQFFIFPVVLIVALAWAARKALGWTFSIALSRCLMLGGVAVFGYSLYLDWSIGYSRRGMEALMFLIMWAYAAGLYLIGLIIGFVARRSARKAPDVQQDG